MPAKRRGGNQDGRGGPPQSGPHAAAADGMTIERVGASPLRAELQLDAQGVLVGVHLLWTASDAARRPTARIVAAWDIRDHGTHPAPDAPVAVRRVAAYLRGDAVDFADVPISLRGTDFQCAVWNELRKIPYGETRSYGEIAAAIDRPGAARAVGAANHDNPIAIVVPCHRVIGGDGGLVGFGAGLDAKRWLLGLEARQLSLSMTSRGRSVA